MKQEFFVFVQCSSGAAYDVGVAIAKQHNKNVVMINSISGEWDLMLRVAIDNREDVGKEIAKLTRGVEGIRKTNTIVSYPIFDPDEDVYFDPDGDP